jgi:hypothetical protein
MRSRENALWPTPHWLGVSGACFVDHLVRGGRLLWRRSEIISSSHILETTTARRNAANAPGSTVQGNKIPVV